MRKIIIVTLISFVLLPGCSHLCSPNSITPVFVGFSPSDIDTLVLRKYNQNDNFLHVVDTVLVVNPRYFYITSNDTTLVYVNTFSGYTYITANFDWQIYIPSKNRTVSISNIISKQTETSCWKCGCISPIISFMQDGHFTTSQVDSVKMRDYQQIGYVAYIHN